MEQIREISDTLIKLNPQVKQRFPSEVNQIYPEDRAAHDWYRFVLSFPPHLVREYLHRFKISRSCQVLDPFCGTGTTLVECKKLGIPSIGIDANLIAHFASQVKVDWHIDGKGLIQHAYEVAEATLAEFAAFGIADQFSESLPLLALLQNKTVVQLKKLSPEAEKLLLTNSISPLPLHKTLVLLNQLKKAPQTSYLRHEQLALAKALVYSISNLHFGPEVGVRHIKEDASVINPWLSEIRRIADDLPEIESAACVPSVVYQADSRSILQVLEPCSIDAVITSPPYPNEKDYTRTTRLESVLLGFICNQREDIVQAAEALGIKLPKNIGDVIYSFRYRAMLPDSVQAKASEGGSWIIRPGGRALYRFVLVTEQHIIPSRIMTETKVPDSTPGVVLMYSLGDEQALLAILRYNRLIDIFTGVTCYSLQNHLRATVPELGQVETDEIYIGVDHRGAHYVFPVQAKGGKDKLSIVQIEQDLALCKAKFPPLICRPIAAQFMKDNLIVLFEFEDGEKGVTLSREKHYRLVTPEEITSADLETYRNRLLNE